MLGRAGNDYIVVGASSPLSLYVCVCVYVAVVGGMPMDIADVSDPIFNQPMVLRVRVRVSVRFSISPWS